MAEPYRPPKRARGRWGDAETTALIKAWKPIHNRRRKGELDEWVPARRHDRVRSSRCLVAEDWRLVAAAVNASRDAKSLGSHRTHEQCKDRMSLLTKMYWKKSSGAAPSSWRFITTLRDVLSPADQPIGPAPSPAPLEPELVQDADMADDGAVEEGSGADAEGTTTTVEPEQHQEDNGDGDTVADMRGPVAADGSGDDAAGYVRRSAAVAGLSSGGDVEELRIPKRPRTAGSSASGAAATRGEASADVFRAAAADLFGAAPATGGSAASVSAVAEVVMKVTAEMCQNVTAMCQNVMMKSLEVERVAAEAARVSGAGNRP